MNTINKKEYLITWRRNNPEYSKKYHQTYVRKTPKKYNAEKEHLYYLANREDKIAFARAWEKANPEKHKLNLKARRHSMRVAGKFPKTEWIKKLIELHYKCQICGKTEPDVKITIDHIIPLSKGGTNDINNLQPLCLSCNSRKQNK